MYAWISCRWQNWRLEINCPLSYNLQAHRIFFKDFYSVCKNVCLPVYRYIPCMPNSQGSQKIWWFHWNWSCRQLRLPCGFSPGSFAKAAGTLKDRANSPAPSRENFNWGFGLKNCSKIKHRKYELNFKSEGNEGAMREVFAHYHMISSTNTFWLVQCFSKFPHSNS